MEAILLKHEQATNLARESVTLPQAWQSDLVDGSGARYRLFVDIPRGPAPPSGYPAIFLVDGTELFATTASTLRVQSKRPDVTGVPPAVVVGLGYPVDDPSASDRRSRDLLPDREANRFLAFIEEIVLTAIAKAVPIDERKRVILGHSFGGLFVLHTLFSRPGLFRTHIAGSPSIWWNDRAILREEAVFRSAPGKIDARVLMTVGEQEQIDCMRDDSHRAERSRTARMVDNAKEMAARLRASRRLSCECVVFTGENHGSVIPAMLSRAVAFSFSGASGTSSE